MRPVKIDRIINPTGPPMACRMRVVGRVVTAMPTPMIAEQMVHPINACANIKHHCLRESRSIALRFKHEM
jgi:hypothetical protein